MRWPAMDVQAADEALPKYRFSAFMPGASDLRGCGRGGSTLC